MDEITNQRFTNLERKIDGLEERLNRRMDGFDDKVDGVESRLSAKLDTVAKGFEIALAAAAKGIAAHIDQRLGELTDKRVTDLEARLARVEAVLMGGSKQ